MSVPPPRFFFVSFTKVQTQMKTHSALRHGREGRSVKFVTGVLSGFFSDESNV